MAMKEGVKINHRVLIAMDALTASQKKALEPLLRDRQGFMVDASRRRMRSRIPRGMPSTSGTQGMASCSPIPSWTAP